MLCVFVVALAWALEVYLQLSHHLLHPDQRLQKCNPPEQTVKVFQTIQQQAILLDIALFFPSLFGVAGAGLSPEIKAALTEPACDFIFLTLLACILYSCVGNVLTGAPPNKIPVIGDAAERTVGGPFDE